MRLPINQVPINGTSVNVWVEAAVSSSGAAAFGIAVRNIKPTAISASTAQATVSVDRTAYPTLPAHANEARVAVDVLRTAHVRLVPVEPAATIKVTATRYANVRLSESAPNVADATLDDSSVIVFAVVKARRAQGSATTWIPRDKVRVIKTRLQKLTSTRTSTAEIRFLPNTIIGQGRAEAISESRVLAGALPIQHSVTGSITADAASTAGIFSRIRPTDASTLGQAQADIGPTIVRQGIRYSYNHGRAALQADARLTPLKHTQGTWAAAGGASQLGLAVSRVQSVTGEGVGAAASQGMFGQFHVHRMTAHLQVSSFSYLGTAQYRLIWADGVCAPRAELRDRFANLRWVGVTATVIGRAAPVAAYWRRVPLSIEARTQSTSQGRYRVYRRSVRERLEPQAQVVGVGVRLARTSGSCMGVAAYGPAVGSRAVRWVGHGNKQASSARAESVAQVPKRIIPVRAPYQVGEAVADMTPVRKRLVQSLDNGYANSVNLIAPLRIAIMQHSGSVAAHAALNDSQVGITHRVPWTGLLRGACSSTADGLKLITVQTPPALEGNAALFRALFKINADSPAPYTRQIILPYVDRSLSVSATDREYRV